MSNYASLYEDQLPLPVKQPTLNLSDKFKPNVTEISLFCPMSTVSSATYANSNENNNNNRLFTNSTHCYPSNQPQSFRDWKEKQEQSNQQIKVQHRILPMVPENITSSSHGLKKQVRFEPAVQSMPVNPVHEPQLMAPTLVSSAPVASTAPVFNGLELSMCDPGLKNQMKLTEPLRPLLSNLYRTADMSYLAKGSPQATNLINSAPVSSRAVPSYQPPYQFPSPDPSLPSSTSSGCGCKCPHQMSYSPQFQQPLTTNGVYIKRDFLNSNGFGSQMNSSQPFQNGYQYTNSYGTPGCSTVNQPNVQPSEHNLRHEMEQLKRQCLSFQEELSVLRQQMAELLSRGLSPVPPNQQQFEAALYRIDVETEFDRKITAQKDTSPKNTPASNKCDKSINTSDQPIANSTNNSTDRNYYNHILHQVNHVLDNVDETPSLELNSNAVKFIDSDISSESIMETPKGILKESSASSSSNGSKKSSPKNSPTVRIETRSVDKSCVINALAEKYLKEEMESFANSTTTKSSSSRRSGGSDSTEGVAVSTTCYNYMGKYNLLEK